MAGGFRRLGEALLGGDIDREGAFLEGQDIGSRISLRRGQTTSALATARERQSQARLQEQEADEKAKLGDAFIAAGLDPKLASLVASGTNKFGDVTGGLGDIQEQGFRGNIADIALPFEERQAAAQAVEGKVVDPLQFGPSGELFADVFRPRGPQVTATGEAAISADEALAQERVAQAKLRDEKRLHPERFKTSTNVGTVPLSEAILPGGKGDSIIPEGFVAEEGFGAESVLKGGVNVIADSIGFGTPFEDSAIASNTLSELSARIQIAMRADVPGGRPPVIVQELLARYAEDPQQLFRGDKLARNNLRTTLASLKRSLARTIQKLDSPSKKTPTRQGKLEDAALALSDTVADLEAVEASFARTEDGSQGDASTLDVGGEAVINGVTLRRIN